VSPIPTPEVDVSGRVYQFHHFGSNQICCSKNEPKRGVSPIPTPEVDVSGRVYQFHHFGSNQICCLKNEPKRGVSPIPTPEVDVSGRVYQFHHFGRQTGVSAKKFTPFCFRCKDFMASDDRTAFLESVPAEFNSFYPLPPLSCFCCNSLIILPY
jgi:hypothetical protein